MNFFSIFIYMKLALKFSKFSENNTVESILFYLIPFWFIFLFIFIIFKLRFSKLFSFFSSNFLLKYKILYFKFLNFFYFTKCYKCWIIECYRVNEIRMQALCFHSIHIFINLLKMKQSSCWGRTSPSKPMALRQKSLIGSQPNQKRCVAIEEEGDYSSPTIIIFNGFNGFKIKFIFLSPYNFYHFAIY